MQNKEKSKMEYAGTITGMELNTVNNYFEEKFHGEQGHGFAAERANHMYDKLTGNDAQIVGDDNALNGADRIVNGVRIQSKYCETGERCIQECFKNGEFKYTSTTDQIEVPSDKYEDAVRAMQRRIDNGQVKGVADARDIVRKGHFTYEQAKNIAKAGTIESLTYDSINGIQIAGYSGGITAAITFGISIARGKSFNDALLASAAAGLKTGGVAFAVAVLSGQLNKIGLNAALRGSSDFIARKVMGSKARQALVKLVGKGSNGIFGEITMKHVAPKLLRSNAVTGIATVIVLSARDVINIFQGRISGAQLFKNVINTSAGVAGGTGGWLAGAKIGAEVGGALGGPVGAAAGGFFGGITGAIFGGSAATKASETVTDAIIDDDSKKMLQIIQDEFQNISSNYLLDEHEAESVVDNLNDKLDGDLIKDMYGSRNRQRFAYEFIEKNTLPVVRKRKKVHLPSDEEMVRGLNCVLERAYDAAANENDGQSDYSNGSNDAYISTWLELGYNYLYGRNGVKMNSFEARKYFEKAANAGSYEAKDMLKRMGKAYDAITNEHDRQSDYPNGSNDAYISTWLELGYNYLYGRNGVKINSFEARKYFEKAARTGNHEARDMLKRI